MLNKLLSYLHISFCWVFIAPLGFIYPRKKGQIIVTGKQAGWLEGNALHFFLEGIRKGENVKFLTRDKSILENHPELSNHLLIHPSLTSYKALLSTSYFVVDHSHWSLYYPIYYFLSIRAKRVHLWHGLTYKPVELGNIKGKYSKFKARIFRRLIKYDIMVSTSDYWTKILYQKYFLSKEILNFGYPRNDVLFRKPDALDLTKVDNHKFATLQTEKKQGSKIIIYAPTFRDKDRSDAFSSGYLDFKQMNEFLSESNLILVLKFHPRNKNSYPDFSNIMNIDKNFDIYPVMGLSDLLITDYSSIYIDYLILDRPIIFFNYDYEEYMNHNRSLQNSFLDTIPGVVTKNQKDLQEEIINHLIYNLDPLAKKRTNLKNLSYEYLDGNSSKRIYDHLQKN